MLHCTRARVLPLAFVFAAFPLVTGCDEKPSAAAPASAANRASRVGINSKEAAVAAARPVVGSLRTQIGEFETKLTSLSEPVRATVAASLETARGQLANVDARFKDLEDSTDQSWSDANIALGGVMDQISWTIKGINDTLAKAAP